MVPQKKSGNKKFKLIFSFHPGLGRQPLTKSQPLISTLQYWVLAILIKKQGCKTVKTYLYFKILIHKIKL